MTGHPAYKGYTCDHLYPDCPSLARVTDAAKTRWGIGERLVGFINPAGGDVCMMCVHRWKGGRDAAV
jgi:hypothetical protein